MNKLKLYSLILIFFISTNCIYANHIIEGVIFSSDITEGVISTIPVGDTPLGVGVNPVTNKIYVCNTNDNTVSVINGSSNFREKNITVGNDPRYLAVNSKTNKIYVANRLEHTVSIIDGNTNNVLTTINAGQRPFAVACNSETNKVYVTNEDSSAVSLIDGATNTVTKTISVNQKPQGIAVNSKTNRIYVANSESDSISVIDGSTDTVTTTIQNIATFPQDIAIDESANRIFVAAQGGTLYVISGATNTVETTSTIGKNATNIAFHPSTGKVYVTIGINGTIEVFDGRRLKPIYLLGAILQPSGIAVNSETHLIYVCDFTGDALKVVEDTLIREHPAPVSTATPTPVGSGTSGGLPTPQPEATPEGGSGGESLGSGDLMNELRGAIAEMDLTADQLIGSHKLAKGVAIAIKSALSNFLTHLNTIEGGSAGFTAIELTQTCIAFIESDLSALRNNISKLRKKSCSVTRKNRKCIPAQIADVFVGEFEKALIEMEGILDIDVNSDTLADVCQ